MKGMLTALTGKLEKLTNGLLEEFYNKMQKATEQLQEKLAKMQSGMTQYIDNRMEEIGGRQASMARDQLAEVYLKVSQRGRGR